MRLNRDGSFRSAADYYADPYVPKLDPGPKGTNVLPNHRVGDDTRNRYVEHLSNLHAKGYLDVAEHDARITAAMKAKTEPELKILVRDLEAVPRKPVTVDYEMVQEKPRTYIPGLIGVMVGSYWMFVPALMINHSGWLNSLHGTFAGIASTSFGTAILVLSIMFMISVVKERKIQGR